MTACVLKTGVGAAESQGLHRVFVAIKAILPRERRGDEGRGGAGREQRWRERGEGKEVEERERKKQLFSTTSLI